MVPHDVCTVGRVPFRIDRSAAILLAILVSVAVPTSAAARDAPPPDSLRQSDLVEVTLRDSTLHADVRYATTNNFMGRPMYSQARVFLQRPAAEALMRANRALRRLGFGLLLFDGYRPWSVTKAFWDATPRAQRIYVANPRKGSKHNRGCAIDCSLYDLATGREVPMPSPYDDFTNKAAAAYEGGTASERRTRGILRRAMEEQGFAVNPDEWWHFDYKDWKSYPILDIPFEQLP